MYHADLLGGIAAKMAGNIPIAWDIQHGTFDSQKNKRMTILTAQVCARLSSWLPARVVCCSEATRLTHISIGYMERKMVVIPNSIDLDIFCPHPLTKVSVRDELGLPADTLLIGLIARFSPEKDHATFVRAAGLFHIFFPDIHFLLCGEGVTWENQELADWIDAAGVRSHAHLLGRRDDIPRLTATLDIATLCSSSEAFGIVVCEAMACTVPCTVTNIGVLADIVGDTGRVVPPRDPQALAAAWQELIEMGAEKRAELGARARQRVEERFSITAAAAQYEALYRELAHAGRNHRS
jgi:glycosyltransferase involved in cell wall biosynthesis